MSGLRRPELQRGDPGPAHVDRATLVGGRLSTNQRRDWARHEPPIIRIEDWSPDGAADQPTAGADRVLIVTVWGGYNKCLRSGKNLGFVVERVGGVWRRVGKGARFIEYMH
jgi:hypothetical protein